jgi:hypothetical protein
MCSDSIERATLASFRVCEEDHSPSSLAVPFKHDSLPSLDEDRLGATPHDFITI